MSAQPAVLRTSLEVLWAEYLSAREKAESSTDIQDGIKAGRAWSRFLREFSPDGPTRKAVHGDVVQIHR
jgi:hypothetical protein